MLHGFPELGHSWRHRAAALARAGYRAIVPDLRGYGESDRPEGTAAYAFPSLVGDVLGLITALGYDSAHVAGHDWGGSLAWMSASRAPGQVRSLMIVNSPHPVAGAECRQMPEQQQKSWHMLLFQFEGVAEEWLAKDDMANLERFVFDTAAPDTFGAQARAGFKGALARPGALRSPLRLGTTAPTSPRGLAEAAPGTSPRRGPHAHHVGRGRRLHEPRTAGSLHHKGDGSA